MSPYLKGQVIVLQAEELIASRKLIHNFETWAQCFALFAAVVISHDPSRAGDLMAYSHSMPWLRSIPGHLGSYMINYSGRSQLEYPVACGARRIPALMPSASIGGLCCHPMGAGFASLWIIRLINAHTNPHLQSGQKGKGGTLKSLVVNLIIIMATVVLGIN